MVPTHMIQPKLCCTQARSGPDNRMPMDAPFRWCIDRHRVTCRLGKHPWPFTNKAPNSRQPNATATELRHESGFSRSPSRPWVFFPSRSWLHDRDLCIPHNELLGWKKTVGHLDSHRAHLDASRNPPKLYPPYPAQVPRPAHRGPARRTRGQ